jgi:hypothetical protein
VSLVFLAKWIPGKYVECNQWDIDTGNTQTIRMKVRQKFDQGLKYFKQVRREVPTSLSWEPLDSGLQKRQYSGTCSKESYVSPTSIP